MLCYVRKQNVGTTVVIPTFCFVQWNGLYEVSSELDINSVRFFNIIIKISDFC